MNRHGLCSTSLPTTQHHLAGRATTQSIGACAYRIIMESRIAVVCAALSVGEAEHGLVDWSRIQDEFRNSDVEVFA